MLGKEGEDRDARFLSRQGDKILERNYRTLFYPLHRQRSCRSLAITKTYLDEILIMDRQLGYKLLCAFTKTLSKRLRGTNEKMASFLAISGGFYRFFHCPSRGRVV